MRRSNVPQRLITEKPQNFYKSKSLAASWSSTQVSWLNAWSKQNCIIKKQLLPDIFTAAHKLKEGFFSRWKERHKKMPKAKWKVHKMLQISINTNYCAELYLGTTLCHIHDFAYYHRSSFGFTTGILRELNFFFPHNNLVTIRKQCSQG